MTESCLPPTSAWRTRLAADLLTAREAGDTVSAAALRSALTALDNAETPELSDAQVRDLLRLEIAEMLHSAHTIDAHDPRRSRSLHAEAAVLRNLLDTTEVG